MKVIKISFGPESRIQWTKLFTGQMARRSNGELVMRIRRGLVSMERDQTWYEPPTTAAAWQFYMAANGLFDPDYVEPLPSGTLVILEVE